MTAYLHLYNIKQNFSQNEKCSSDNNVEKIKTRLCSITFISKLCRLWDNVEQLRYSQAGHAVYNMAHALCMLYYYGYRHTTRICITYCFSMANIVTRTRRQCYVIGALPVLSNYNLRIFSFISHTEHTPVRIFVTAKTSHTLLERLCG